MLADQLTEQRRIPPGARADLQHRLARLHGERVQHARHRGRHRGGTGWTPPDLRPLGSPVIELCDQYPIRVHVTLSVPGLQDSNRRGGPAATAAQIAAVALHTCAIMASQSASVRMNGCSSVAGRAR